ncbi:MAG: hypothetical protein KGQ54_03420 [Verrucomicrobia bacterium]|nr:hypothetical protein [Verrucomicrobiota bacterium]
MSFLNTLFRKFFLISSVFFGIEGGGKPNSDRYIIEVSGEFDVLGMCVTCKSPRQITWVQGADLKWELTARFNYAEIITYFEKAPPLKGLGLSPDNRPIKQKFVYRGDTYLSRDCTFEQWPDGTKFWSFDYKEFVLVKEKDYFKGCTTSLMEESDSSKYEIQYDLWKSISKP